MAKMLTPVFAGDTPEGDRIVLYKCGDEFHIRRPDGELWALSPSAIITTWDGDESDSIHLKIQASEWTGTANGTRYDLVEAESIRIGVDINAP